MFVANFFHVCLASLRSDHNSDSVASLLISPHISHMWSSIITCPRCSLSSTTSIETPSMVQFRVACKKKRRFLLIVPPRRVESVGITWRWRVDCEGREWRNLLVRTSWRCIDLCWRVSTFSCLSPSWELPSKALWRFPRPCCNDDRRPSPGRAASCYSGSWWEPDINVGLGIWKENGDQTRYRRLPL